MHSTIHVPGGAIADFSDGSYMHSCLAVSRKLFVNVNVNLYSALSHSASNALGAPSTAIKASSLRGDRSWRC